MPQLIHQNFAGEPDLAQEKEQKFAMKGVTMSMGLLTFCHLDPAGRPSDHQQLDCYIQACPGPGCMSFALPTLFAQGPSKAGC